MHDEPDKTADEIRSYPPAESRWVWLGILVYLGGLIWAVMR
jgi:hypothetical protein